jgi:TRAP-type C4-dicarboxylate transport system substrate-binding protein
VRALGQFLRRQRNFKRARHSHHLNIFFRSARGFERAEGAVQKAFRDEAIEAADDQREAKSGRVRPGADFLRSE